ncbi:hypothetical protein [Bacillus cereus]|uniref:hypothetical protein n=1 Tax=Bacillus cereus TaxID=1396 RepID=UPI00396CF56C
MKSLDELKHAEEKPKYRLGDFQFFAKKKDEEEPEEDDQEEEEEEPKSDEEAPAWANNTIKNIAKLINPTEQPEGTQKVPVYRKHHRNRRRREGTQAGTNTADPVGKFLKWLL